MAIKINLTWLAAFLSCALAAVADGPFLITPRLQLNEAGATRLVVQVELAPGTLLYADQFQVAISKPAGIAPLALAVPQKEKDSFSGEEKLVYTRSFTNVYLVENAANGVDVTVCFQGCDQNTCFLPTVKEFHLQLPAGPGGSRPEKNVTGPAENTSADWLNNIRQNYQVVAMRAGYLGARDFSAFLDMPARGDPDAVQEAWRRGSIGLLILLIVLGGLALNLTPCVLPLIPVNLAIIGAGIRAGSPARGFLRGGFYGLGIALAYGALGLLSVLTGAQFGAINASPWFNLGVAFIFLVLALALLDLVAIDFSRLQSRLPTRGKGLLFILVMGALAALLAGACVAPVVIAVLLLAANLSAQGQWIGLILPFLLGVGMALPWPFAGAGLSFLPKPGNWMLHIKRVFVVVILLAALYYGVTGGRLLYHKYAGRADLAAQSARLPSSADQWRAFPEGLPAPTDKRPVLLYFWATWCKNCEAMKITTFKDENVIRKLRDFVCLKIQADDARDGTVARVLREFGVRGVPTFVILKPRQ